MFFSDLRKWLKGAPDNALTAYLVIVAILSLMVAFFAPAEVKLVFLVWMVAP